MSTFLFFEFQINFQLKSRKIQNMIEKRLSLKPGSGRNKKKCKNGILKSGSGQEKLLKPGSGQEKLLKPGSGQVNTKSRIRTEKTTKNRIRTRKTTKTRIRTEKTTKTRIRTEKNNLFYLSGSVY